MEDKVQNDGGGSLGFHLDGYARGLSEDLHRTWLGVRYPSASLPIQVWALRSTRLRGGHHSDLYRVGSPDPVYPSNIVAERAKLQ